MKSKLLSLVMSVCASAVLIGCGGGSDASVDPSDKYIGTWKSQCFPYVANNGLTRYTTLTKIATKTGPSSFSLIGPNGNAYADSGCTSLVASGVYTSSTGNLTLGSSVTFAGLPSEAMVYTIGSETRPGFSAVSGAQMYLVTYDPNVSLPSGWGIASPYIRQ